MKIVILGATGNVGQATVQAALDAGHTVTAYVRRPEVVPTAPGLTAIGGSLENLSSMAQAFSGADAIIHTAGSPTGRFAQLTLPIITAAARQADVERFVLVSGFGVGDSKTKASWFAQSIYSTMVKKLFNDKALAEAAVLPSLNMNWTAVYPVNLKSGPKSPTTVKALEEVAKVPGLPTLTYASVGSALVEIASDKSLDKKQLLVTTEDGWRGI
ncbi:NAD(P)-dependent oxidoreductase [Leucobacter sp. HY1908]